jgi:hypothetical protein
VAVIKFYKISRSNISSGEEYLGYAEGRCVQVEYTHPAFTSFGTPLKRGYIKMNKSPSPQQGGKLVKRLGKTSTFIARR